MRETITCLPFLSSEDELIDLEMNAFLQADHKLQLKGHWLICVNGDGEWYCNTEGLDGFIGEISALRTSETLAFGFFILLWLGH